MDQHETSKVFKLVNKAPKNVENLTQEQVEKRAKDAIDRFRQENPHLDPNKKIYIVLG